MADTKYKKKYATELKKGLRRQGMSIEHCCEKWGISRPTYYRWIKEYTSFAEAAEIGERDFYLFWYELGMDGASGKKRVNAGVYNYVMTNLHRWSTKTESKQTHDEQIQTITINVIEGRKPLVIEQQPDVES